MMVFKKIKENKLFQGMAAGLIGAAVALAFFLPGWLDRWEAKTWDLRVSTLAKPSDATDKIRVVLLDQSSLDWGKEENALSWPWPREVYGAVIDFCKRAGARSIAFDILYTEHSKDGVSDDQIMVDAMRTMPVVGTVFLSRNTGSETSWPDFAPAPAFQINGMEEWITKTGYKSYEYVTFPIPEIAEAAHILANVQMRPDNDNVYRRVTLLEVFDGKAMPTLGLANYLAAHPETKMSIAPGKLIIGDKTIPIDDKGQAILNFRGPSRTHQAYSASAVIQSALLLAEGENPVINTEEFKDAYVFFGFSAPGLYDLRPTPVSGVYPGVEVFATMLDNLLTGDFIMPTPLAFTIALTLLIALLAGMFSSWATGTTRSVLVYVVFMALPVIICFAAYILGFWLPLVVQETAVAVTLVSAGLIYYTTEGKQKTYIKNAFKQYLSPDVIEQLIAHPERLKLGGERKPLSVFFSDLEGFTGISEGLDPEALTNLLNTYLSAMTDIIHEEGGTVDKYEGDAIIAFWNAPLEQPDHAVRCVRAALNCQAKLAQMRPEFYKSLNKNLNMRIGINTGQAVVGNMGSKSRFDYTMIGDAVNLAARLEGINKQFGTYTLISQATKEQIADAFPTREISRVEVVGRKEPVVVYEPLLPEEITTEKQKLFKKFATALKLFYEGNFKQAESLFSEIAEQDAAAKAYVQKCAELIAQPPTNWHGVWVATQK
ncbi:MAG: adenylate/guanylate cyclase domain-containing protein [Syntrophaceae bacterium]|nr:adenylate/guanylate cyclase domain-containing protein [Syntrophaceae bacterium]